MTVPSVLVVGDGMAGCVAAVALAGRGIDVALIERSPQWGSETQDGVLDAAARRALERVGARPAGSENGAPARMDRREVQRTLIDLLRQHGVEVRMGLSLVGSLDLGTHVEAELSNAQVENFDAVVDARRIGVDEALALADALLAKVTAQSRSEP